MNQRVFLSGCCDYDGEKVRLAVKRAIDAFGGAEALEEVKRFL